jgi:hypothetical protein
MAVRLCKAGLHRLTRDNIYEHPQKGVECRECKRTYMREYMRERRAAAKARPKSKAKRR